MLSILIGSHLRRQSTWMKFQTITRTGAPTPELHPSSVLQSVLAALSDCRGSWNTALNVWMSCFSNRCLLESGTWSSKISIRPRVIREHVQDRVVPVVQNQRMSLTDCSYFVVIAVCSDHETLVRDMKTTARALVCRSSLVLILLLYWLCAIVEDKSVMQPFIVYSVAFWLFH